MRQSLFFHLFSDHKKPFRGDVLTAYTQHHWRNKLFTCTFSRDGQFLATADQTGRVVIWEFESREEAAVGGIFNTDAAIANGQALLQIFEWQADGTHFL